MHSAAAAANPLQTLLDLINSTLSLLLCSSLIVRSFVGCWTTLYSKLASLHSSIADISDSPHWAQNPLLYTLLPQLLSTLQHLTALADQCTDARFPPPAFRPRAGYLRRLSPGQRERQVIAQGNVQRRESRSFAENTRIRVDPFEREGCNGGRGAHRRPRKRLGRFRLLWRLSPHQSLPIWVFGDPDPCCQSHSKCGQCGRNQNCYDSFPI
ncbi:vacuolar protein 8 [Pyrus ussuriensis x Pyrus communis]|uniref:Vacuolar protein 8 n=1 Tax=Pyrus ussuriensis x Pyrus communis TaxID=2448454 RepID=A0A5N5GVB0_9ROSA|nr:vacuolar protein 8 [Pyrus ussuriensis x Pyrus communis]